MRNVEEDGPRWWVIESTDQVLSLDGIEADEYCGLVDEDEGGIVAWGMFEALDSIAVMLNLVEAETPICERCGHPVVICDDCGHAQTRNGL